MPFFQEPTPDPDPELTRTHEALLTTVDGHFEQISAGGDGSPWSSNSASHAAASRLLSATYTVLGRYLDPFDAEALQAVIHEEIQRQADQDEDNFEALQAKKLLAAIQETLDETEPNT